MSEFANHPLSPGEALPFFISAGILKEPAQLERFLEIEDPLMQPMLTLGSFTLTEWAGNAKPGEQDFVYYPELRMAGNAIGLRNPGKEGLLALRGSIKALREQGFKVVVSITNLPHETPSLVLPELFKVALGVEPDGVEVNLSCPNGKKADGSLHAPVCSDAAASQDLTGLLRETGGPEVCLGAKDSPHVTSLDDSVNLSEVQALASGIAPYIDFLTGINTIGNQDFPAITCTNGKAGMSGPVVADIARQHLAAWQEYAPELAYLSCGGVDSQNAGLEVPARLGAGALRVGGAQEFYRATHPYQVTPQWALA